jgi:hypothetical protein
MVPHDILIVMPIKQFQLNNAKVYNNRWEWVTRLPKRINIMEVGVSAGDFAEHMHNTLMPNVLYLVDTWEQSDSIFQRGEDNLRFKEGENLDFVTKRFANKNVTIFSGTSQEVLPKIIMDKSSRSFDFDLIYIDAGHSYDEVTQDINNAVKLLNQRGVIVVNDYVFIGDPKYPAYGVIKAVNDFLENNIDWEMSGIILEDQMMCDVILRRIR